MVFYHLGRWTNNLILICNNGTVEDEEHFLLHCNFYQRQDVYNYMKNNIPNFNNLSKEQKLQTIITKEYVVSIYGKLPNETEQTICLIIISKDHLYH